MVFYGILWCFGRQTPPRQADSFALCVVFGVSAAPRPSITMAGGENNESEGAQSGQVWVAPNPPLGLHFDRRILVVQNLAPWPQNGTPQLRRLP